MNGNTWKIVSLILGFCLTIGGGLVWLPYNNLTKADDSCTTRLTKIEEKTSTNCSDIKVHNSRLKSLEENSGDTKEQLSDIKSILTRTATIVERLDKKIDSLDKNR